MKTKAPSLQIDTDTLGTLGFYGLLLLGSLLSTSIANATNLLRNESVYEHIERAETYQQQEKYQLKEQRNVVPVKAFSMVDARCDENSNTPKFTLNP